MWREFFPALADLRSKSIRIRDTLISCSSFRGSDGAHVRERRTRARNPLLRCFRLRYAAHTGIPSRTRARIQEERSAGLRLAAGSVRTNARTNSIYLFIRPSALRIRARRRSSFYIEKMGRVGSVGAHVLGSQ